MSGSGISWAICKSAPSSKQTTTLAPHHSVFYRPDALPATQPTASKHWRQKCKSEAAVLIDDNDTTINSNEEIAEHFTCYFMSVFMCEDYSETPKLIYVGDFYITWAKLQFDVSTVLAAIPKLRQDKSTGPDDLAPKLLLETKDLISYPLYLLFKKSYSHYWWLETSYCYTNF